MNLRILGVALLLSCPALAEQAPVNFHLDPLAGTGLDKAKFVSGATLKIDTTLIQALGPVAPQIEFFGLSAIDRTYLDDGSAFGGGIGLRLRLFNDERGYFWNPGQNRKGNVWGNAWIDAHATLASGGFGVGFDAAVGAEFSLIEGLSVGPYAKYIFFGARRGIDAGPHSLLVFGLSFTIGAPQTTPKEADYDGDGLKGDDDACVDEAEDVDGFEDADGCPDKDNDKDGVADEADACRNEAEDLDKIADTDGCPEVDADGDGTADEADQCPLQSGAQDNRGCPDVDTDGDAVVDRLDACVDVKGVADNRGCPDVDTDNDGTVDRLDKCPAVVGPANNQGCPFADSDGDGVADNLDNCIQESGPVSNQGCPVSQKQLVAITARRLEIREKVYFSTNKAVVLPKSFPLLEQIARVLNGHPEIAKIQVEGHTDNVGDAPHNRVLSTERAQAVVAFLLKAGVAENRLVAVGFGPDRPAADNKTAKGRENNRRVEFNILP